MVEQLDYCLDFVTFEWEYDIEYNTCRCENCLSLIVLGIRAVQNELNKPDLALGINEFRLQFGVGDMHVNR